jgi:hypothetical protein
MTTYRNAFDAEQRAKEAFFEQFYDFMTYNAADWTITTTEAGAGSATEAVGAGVGGLLVVTNDAADNDLDAFQGAESFKFTVGKQLQFIARFKLNSVTQADLMIGLYITDTDPIGGVTDGIYLRSDDGSADLDFVVEKNSTESVAETVATLVDDTFVEVELYYDGGDSIACFVNDVRVAGLPLDNAPDDEEIALSFVIQNGEAVAKVLTLDYIGARQER